MKYMRICQRKQVSRSSKTLFEIGAVAPVEALSHMSTTANSTCLRSGYRGTGDSACVNPYFHLPMTMNHPLPDHEAPPSV